MDKLVSKLKTIDENRVYALLSYLSLLCCLPLIQKKDNPFVMSHARQGLALFLAEFAAFLVTILLPVLLKPLLLVFGLLAFWGMLAALKGQTVCLPFIHALSRRLTL